MGVRAVSLGGVVVATIALNLLGGSALAATPAQPPKPRDVVAARTVIRTLTRYDETAVRDEGVMTAAAKAMVAQVKAGCAGSIPSSIANGTKKQQGVFIDLASEGALDLTVRAIHPLDHAALALSKGLDRVHFSNRAFTRRIHNTGKAQRLLSAIQPSDLCADVKAAAAGGFAADAPGTTAFLKGVDRLDPGPMESVPTIIKKVRADLLTESDRAALKRLHKVDARFQTFSANLGLRWGANLGKVLTSAPPAGGTGPGFPTGPPTPPPTTPPPPPPASSPAAMTSAFAAF
jgi:hypothetical protein